MSEKGKRLALLIASNQYEDATIKQLLAPAQDAEGLAQVLEDKNIGDFEVKILVNEPSHKVKREINRFFINKNRDDLLLLYFSGHGIKEQDGQLYFATSDTEHDLVCSTSVSANFINDLMLRSYSRGQILLLDCCYSGAFAKGAMAKDDKRIGIKERFEGKGRIVLTASDSLQYSFEGKEINGEGSYSIFTRHLVSGLRTGEADEDGDGYVSLDELYDYAYRCVVEEEPNQHPQKWAFDVKGKIIIARNPYAVKNRAVAQNNQPQSYDADADIMIELVLSSRQLQIGTQKWFMLGDRLTKIDIPPKINKKLFPIYGKGKLNPNTNLRGNLYLNIIHDSSPDPLISAKGLSYIQLRDFLALGRWKEADQETYNLILAASKRTEERWISGEDIKNFPLQDLSTIDQLWMRYSDGRFGFSVQKLILQRSKGRPLIFAESVGWYARGIWSLHKELTFSPRAPFGHLPFLPNFILWKDSPRFLQSDGLEAFLERVSLNGIGAEVILRKLGEAGSVLSTEMNQKIGSDGSSATATIGNIIMGNDSTEDQRTVNKQQITGG